MGLSDDRCFEGRGEDLDNGIVLLTLLWPILQVSRGSSEEGTLTKRVLCVENVKRCRSMW